MKPDLTVAIPAHNEEKYIGSCIESVLRSAHHAGSTVELVVALNRCTDRTQSIAESLGARCVNEDKKCIAAVRNAAVRGGTAPAVATLDADSRMTKKTVAAVLKRVKNPRYIGGGTMFIFDRLSVGIFFSILAAAPYLITRGVSAGLFWLKRETFEHIGGFDESLLSAEDLDFALRMKALGKRRGKSYGTIYRHGIITSSRKFNEFGDWCLFKNPNLVRDIFRGAGGTLTDKFYYDVDR